MARNAGGRARSCNAGIISAGPLEFLPLAELRQQFEVNVVGHLAVTQALLPLMRTAPGRIVNIGSISGRSAVPLAGAYVASKFAMEGLSDMLRMELRRWGIAVSLVEPGTIATAIWDKLLAVEDDHARTLAPQAHDFCLLCSNCDRILRFAPHKIA